MHAELKRFDQAIKADTSLQTEIQSNVKDSAGLVSFANERGYNFTLEDLNGAAASLDTKDLDKISGGAGMAPVMVVVVVVPVIIVI